MYSFFYYIDFGYFIACLIYHCIAINNCVSFAISIQFLRHLKEFFGVMFKIEAQQTDDNDSETGGEAKVLLSCVGVGYTNINKTMV